MSISLKVTTAMFLMAIILGLTVVGLQRYLVNTEFQSLQEEFARHNVDRITNRFLVELQNIDTSVYDWSSWNDTYTFAQDRNSVYIESNLYTDTFLNLGTDVALFINLEGDVLWAAIYEFHEDSEVTERTDMLLDGFLPEALALTERIDLHVDVREQVVKGLFQLDDLPVLFSLRPIYNSSGKGKASGYVLFGKTVSEHFLSQLKNDVALNFEISDLMSYDTLSNLPIYEIVASESGQLEIVQPFLPSQSGGFLITNPVEKRFTQIGLAATKTVIVAFMMISLLVISVTWWWLQKTIIFPVKLLKNSILSTRDSNDYTQRLQAVGSDEISVLAKAFNDLLETVEQRTQVLNNTNEKLQREQQHQKVLQIELEAANAELQILSEKDPLTGLYNRMAMEHKLTQEWNVLRRKNEPLSVLMIDIDRFKEYNDHYGHQAGDDCLRRVAIVLSSIAQRASDMVARYGGEEFILIFPNIMHQIAYQMAQNLLKKIEAECITHVHSEFGHITVSVGIACVTPSETTSLQDLISNADAALYRAKRHGRNQVCL